MMSMLPLKTFDLGIGKYLRNCLSCFAPYKVTTHSPTFTVQSVLGGYPKQHFIKRNK